MYSNSPTLVARYIDQLPAGMSSYPQCVVTAVLFNRICADEPRVLQSFNKEDKSTALEFGPPRDGALIPLTFHVCAILTLATLRNWDAAQTKQQIKQYGKAILDTPAYHKVFSVIGPSLVVLGSSIRYAHDFKGVTLSSKQLSKLSARMTITFPPKLYSPFYVNAYNGIFEAALEAAKARAPTSSIEEITQTTAVTLFSWT